MNFVILSGSFHSHSKSLILIENIKTLLQTHSFTIPRLDRLPFYSVDLEQNKPGELTGFLEQINQADGLIFITPEYNHSIPAVLKNAIDWASRPAFNSPLKDKPVAIITQADSPVGGARAQAHLKLILDATLSRLPLSHEMMIGQIDSVLDVDGHITGDTVLSRLQRYLEQFITFIQCEHSHG